MLTEKSRVKVDLVTKGVLDKNISRDYKETYFEIP